jgi:hypothetical protein
VVALADPTARQHLKALFFRDVQVPTGRHLARLDMTEAAFLSLDQAFDTLPGDRRPREDDRNTAAHAIGCEFADFVIAGAKGPQPIEPLAERVVELLELHCELTEDEAEQVTPIVLTTLGSFVSTVCAHCPVSCLVQPDTELSEPFFRPLHPMTPA